jgi:hypothetical protein
LCSFLHFPVTSPLLGPNTLLNALFSNTLSLRSVLNVSDQFHTHTVLLLLLLLLLLFMDSIQYNYLASSVNTNPDYNKTYIHCMLLTP